MTYADPEHDPRSDPAPGANIWVLHECPASPVPPRPHENIRELVRCEWPHAVIRGRGRYIVLSRCGDTVEVEAVRCLGTARAIRAAVAATCEPGCTGHRVGLVMTGHPNAIIYNPSA